MPSYEIRMCIYFTKICETLDWMTQLNIVWQGLQPMSKLINNIFRR